MDYTLGTDFPSNFISIKISPLLDKLLRETFLQKFLVKMVQCVKSHMYAIGDCDLCQDIKIHHRQHFKIAAHKLDLLIGNKYTKSGLLYIGICPTRLQVVSGSSKYIAINLHKMDTFHRLATKILRIL